MGVEELSRIFRRSRASGIRVWALSFDHVGLTPVK
jgi:hypothetical protein